MSTCDDENKDDEPNGEADDDGEASTSYSCQKEHPGHNYAFIK